MEITGDSRGAEPPGGPGADRAADPPAAPPAPCAAGTGAGTLLSVGIVTVVIGLIAASAGSLGAVQATPPGSAASAGHGAAPPDTAPAARLLERPWEAWVREGAALASLLTLDRPVRTAALELRANAPDEGALDRIADRAEWFGDWEASLPWLVGGSLAVGQLTGGSRGLRQGAALLAGGAAASMANEALNRAVGRARPSWEEGAFSLVPFRGHAAFPSGHTAYVFGVATGIDVVTEGWIPGAAAYGVAGLTGLSRIYHDRHWFTDVAASAALSTVVSRLATRKALDVLGVAGVAGGEGTSPRGARLEPLVAPRAVGVMIRF